jgi:EmrB/QacA subfamily drug resistance transporter
MEAATAMSIVAPCLLRATIRDYATPASKAGQDGGAIARYVLRIVGGAGPGQEVDLPGSLEIGRDPRAAIPLVDDRLVSSRHARVSPQEDGVAVEDLGSRNGTFVNGIRIAEPTVVRAGGEIVLGDTTFEVVEVPAPEYLLSVAEPGAPPREILLAEPLEAGRDPDAGIVLGRDQLVSRLHARLSPVVGGVAVDDLGSRNGTFVNGVRIEGPTLVSVGGEIRIGETALAVQAAPTPELVLDVIGGQGGRRSVELAGPLEIGRDPAAGLALVHDNLVSRAHARLTPEGEGVRLEDLGSRNGTYLNGAVVQGPTRALPGDRIVVGATVLALHRQRGVLPGMTAVRTAIRPVPGNLTVAGEEQEAIEPVEADPVPGTGAARRQLITFIVCATALFMAVLDNLIVLFALPSIQADLGATVEELEWTVNAFTLAFAVFLLPAATFGDRFGRRRIFTSGIVLFTAASVACALAPSIEAFLVSRAVQGFGAAMIMPLSLTILSDAFPAEKRGLVLGAWSGIAGLAVSLGPVVGGALVTGVSWEWIFWLNAPIGAVLAPLCFLRLRESFGPAERLDLLGLVLGAAGTFGVIFGVVRGSAAGWTSLQVVVPIVAGLILLAAFVAWQLRAPAPMLPMRLFRSRAFSAANGASFLMYFGLFGSIFLLSQFLQVAQGYSALEAGLRALPWTAMPIVVAPFAGMMSEKIGGRPLMAFGLMLQAISLGWLALILEPDVAYLQLVPAFVIGGLGMGLFFAPVAYEILGAVRLEDEGKASGTNNTVRELGGAFGIAVLVTIFSSYGSYASPQDFVDGLTPSIWVGAAVVLVGALTALLIPRVRPVEDASSMTSAVPALGGFTPGVTLIRPALRPAETGVAARRR